MLKWEVMPHKTLKSAMVTEAQRGGGGGDGGDAIDSAEWPR